MACNRTAWNRSQRSDAVITFMLFALSLAGCSGGKSEIERAAVQGTVTLDGQELKAGVVRFIPIESTPGPKTTVNIAQGKFMVDAEVGPVIGRHRIEIVSTDDGGYASDDEGALDQLKKSGVRRIEVVKVPDNYNKQSTLTQTVTLEGPNEFHYSLTTQRR